MDDNSNNPNWQDKLLGGAILTGFVVIALIAAVVTLVTWNDERTADRASSQIIVGSFFHSPTQTQPAHSTN
jgi:hypothetical protein